MEAIFTTQALTKRYSGASGAALDGLTLTVNPGRIVGLLGPNGSGKTTLIKLAAGLLTPTSGSVCIAGQAPGPATKAVVSYLPDRMALPSSLRVEDAVSLYADFYTDFDKTKANAMLQDLKLQSRQRISAMSKGMQEKLQLCLVMSRAAKLYLLDEPLGGVDPAARAYILDTILRNYNEDAALLLSTHLIADVERLLDEAVILRQGQLVTHQQADALREESGESLDAYFREVFKC
ncbi:MAG: ABC transporter ATP-binding protein [Gemmiger sp.]|nr:ABC transporter ATP-binding protein [Gemmiger sp.]